MKLFKLRIESFKPAMTKACSLRANDSSIMIIPSNKPNCQGTDRSLITALETPLLLRSAGVDEPVLPGAPCTESA